MKHIIVPVSLPFTHGTKNQFMPLITNAVTMKAGDTIKVTMPDYTIYGTVIDKNDTPLSCIPRELLSIYTGKARCAVDDAERFFCMNRHTVVSLVWVQKMPYRKGRSIERECGIEDAVAGMRSRQVRL